MNRDAPGEGPALSQGGQAEFVTVAKVVKTQGRIGEVAATLLTDFPERFATRKKLFALCEAASSKPGKAQDSVARREPRLLAQRRELQLEAHWFHKGMVVLKF